MIRFNCNCTHEFLVPEDQAGGMVQCPKCRRLNDVPTLSDLENIEADGSFKIGEGPKAPDKSFLPTASRAFTRDKTDDRGEDIDMRPSVEEFLKLGSNEIPLSLRDEELPGAPKYDPLTGELVEAIGIKAPDQPVGPDAKSIPIATRAVSYATSDLNVVVTPIGILAHLFQPVNLMVMVFVVIAHIILQAFALLIQCGFFLMAPVGIVIAALIVAHYGVIVEEIGAGDADELPRPLRDFSVSEDIWRPFVRFCFAVMVSFWPLIFRERLNDMGIPGRALLITSMLFGIFIFPATLLSAAMAGTYLNMRPDRIVGVIKALGPKYLISVLAYTIGGAIYLAGMGFVNYGAISLLRPGMTRTMQGMLIGTPTLLLGIYLAHFASWHLGLLYRANHDRFPWILQRHISSRRTDTLAQLEAARKAAKVLDAMRANRPDREQRISEIRTAEKTKRASKDAKPIWDKVAESKE